MALLQGQLPYTVCYPELYIVSKALIFLEFSHYIENILIINPSSPRNKDSKLDDIQNSMVYLCVSPPPVSTGKSDSSVKTSASG